MELKIDRVTKQYGSKIAVDRISLTLGRGVHGLLGENGAGKTTFMRMICGILAPTGGSISFDGMEAATEGYRSVLGYLPQDFGYYPDFTGKDFLLYMAALKGLPKRRAGEKAKELIEMTALKEAAGNKIKTYSGGMRQRLGIAVALCGSPDFLLLDEPVNGLDPQGIVEIRELILRLNQEQQITILISSHILDELSKLATHYGFVDRVAMVREVSAAELDAACRKCFRLSVTDTRALCRVLDGMGMEYNIISESEADIYGEVSVTQLAVALDKEGCEVRSMHEHDESLENYYMNLMGGGRNA